MKYSELENVDLLPGFLPLAYSPIELKYSVDFNLKDYYIAVGRSNYPFPIYVKIDKDKSKILEYYPYLIEDSFEKNIDIIKYNEDLRYEGPIPFYFSCDFDSDKHKIYKHTGNKIYLYDGDSCTRKYLQVNNIFGIEPIEIRNFVIESKCSYCILYYNLVTNNIENILLGYTSLNSRYDQIRKELDLF